VPLKVKPVDEEKHPCEVCSADTVDVLSRAVAVARVKESIDFIAYDEICDGRGLEVGEDPLDVYVLYRLDRDVESMW
jgi:hypothetical protein